MIKKLTRDHIEAELAALSALIAATPEDDLLGRMSLESRRDELQQELTALHSSAENRAKIALYFGGEPVVGSAGIEVGFGADGLFSFQDLITKVWAAGVGQLAPMGPIPDRASSQLHITSLVHGSFGFLLEELDERGEPLFESPIKAAADRTVAYIASIADVNEARFVETLEAVDPRVFSAVRTFFGTVYRAKATFRVVEGDTDARFDHVAVERAWSRIEASEMDEERITVEGRLLGMIPVGRRFEFDPDGAMQIIKGKVGEQFSQSYLERMKDEHFAGRRWKAVLHHKIVQRRGRSPLDSYTLLELHEIDESSDKGSGSA